MPNFSAIDRTPAGIKPVATTASHPCAAAATVPNCIATRLAAVFGTSTLAARSAKSGGAHTRTSTPSCLSASANPINGSTSPREPHDDNKTRNCPTPTFLDFWLSGTILGDHRGLAASPPVRYMLKREGNCSGLSAVERRFLEIKPM